MGIPRVALPADARPDPLAVREGLPPSQYGENCDAPPLPSSFVHPDAPTAAPRFPHDDARLLYLQLRHPPARALISHALGTPSLAT